MKKKAKKRGRKRGPTIQTLITKAWDQLRGKPTGTICIVEGWTFTKTRPDKIELTT